MIFYLLDKNEKIIRMLPTNRCDFSVQELNLNGIYILNFDIDVKDLWIMEDIVYIIHKDIENKENFYMYKIISDGNNKDRLEFKAIYIAMDELESYSYITDRKPKNVKVSQAVNIVIANTRWELGKIDDSIVKSLNFYYCSPLKAITKIIDTYNIEIDFRLKAEKNRIVKRLIDVKNQVGKFTGKRFFYGSNALEVIKETNNGSIYTKFIPRGKGEEVGEGFGRRIDIKDIVWSKDKGDPIDKPKGQEFIEFKEMTSLYGHSDGTPRSTIVPFENIEDPNELIEAAYNYGLVNCRPQIAYKSDVERVGRINLGDGVLIIRKDLNIRYVARVYKIIKDLKNPNKTKVELGDNRDISQSKKNMDFQKKIENLDEKLSVTNINFVKKIQEGLTETMYNQESYRYEAIPGDDSGLLSGTWYFNRPIDKNPDKALYLGGGHVAMANKKDSNSNWEFTTIANGDGVIANTIVAGILKGGNVRWNLEDGTFIIGKNANDYSMYWDGGTLHFRNVDIDLKNSKDFSEIKDGLDKKISKDDILEDKEIQEALKGKDGANGVPGKDGKDGIPGKPGADGKTSYMHFAYADSKDGVVGFTQTATVGKKYIGFYTDFEKADSTDPKKYEWSLFKGDDGKDGVAGKNGVGLKSTDISYGLSNSETNEPTSWTKTVPSLVKGKYLWTKTVWTYTDNTTETGYTKTYIAKDGNTGKDGIAGKDGVGIKSTTITYANSTNGTSAPTSGWSSSIPNTSPGVYLWTKTVWNYTDNTSETGYSVSKIGKDGVNGIPGKAGQDGKTPYFHTAWANSSDGSKDFSVSQAGEKMYIGTYTDFVKADSTDPKKYTWQLVKGNTGPKGDKGDRGPTGAKGVDGKDGKTGKIGQNLLRNSNVPVENKNYPTIIWDVCETLKDNEIVTFTMKVKVDRTSVLWIYNSGGAINLAYKKVIKEDNYKLISYTFPWKTFIDVSWGQKHYEQENPPNIHLYNTTSSQSQDKITTSIEWATLTRGDIPAIEWSPCYADVDDAIKAGKEESEEISRKLIKVESDFKIENNNIKASVSSLSKTTERSFVNLKKDMADADVKVETGIKNYLINNYSTKTQTDQKISQEVGSIKTSLGNDINNLNKEVTEAKSMVEQTQRGVTTIVGQVEYGLNNKINDLNARIDIQADKIEAKVSKDGFSSLVKQEFDRYKVQAKNIDFDGSYVNVKGTFQTLNTNEDVGVEMSYNQVVWKDNRWEGKTFGKITVTKIVGSEYGFSLNFGHYPTGFLSMSYWNNDDKKWYSYMQLDKWNYTGNGGITPIIFHENLNCLRHSIRIGNWELVPEGDTLKIKPYDTKAGYIFQRGGLYRYYASGGKDVKTKID